jgi:hypothetical protein
MSCRKQKRKCNKGLPACSLCERMGRLCDYSDASPAPTSDDFNALRQKLLELERRLNGSSGSNGIENTPYLPTPSASTVSGTADSVGATPGTVYLQQDPAYQNVQNRFPGIAFLDSEAFKYGQIVVPKPSVDIPVVSILPSFILLSLFSFQCVWHVIYTALWEMSKTLPSIDAYSIASGLSSLQNFMVQILGCPQLLLTLPAFLIASNATEAHK